MAYPNRPAAIFFTTTTVLATAEMLYTGMHLPYPILTAACGIAAIILAWCAANEWAGLRTHRRTPDPADPRSSR